MKTILKKLKSKEGFVPVEAIFLLCIIMIILLTAKVLLGSEGKMIGENTLCLASHLL